MSHGRIKITTDIVPTGNIAEDKAIIPFIIKNAKALHDINVADMKRLRDYYYNETDIQNKEKTQQPDINNKIGIADASVVVTTINAYCFANPLTISSRNSERQEEIQALLDAVDSDNYNQKTMHTVLDSGIYGLGYKYVRPANSEERENGLFFRTFAEIDPLTTFCVYNNSLEKEKVLAVHYYNKTIYDQNLRQLVTRTEYDCWTKTHQWHFIDMQGQLVNQTYNVIGADGSLVEFDAYPLIYNRIPIVEYERKQDRTGDFELAIDLINAINALASARLDLVEQKSDYMLLLRDIDIEGEALDRVKKAIKDGILAFESNGANNAIQPDVKVLDIEVNQTQLQSLQDFLLEQLEEVTHIPNRDSRTSGSDTGMAVEGRNGYRSLENIAGLVTSCALEAENEMFDIILDIAKTYDDCPFKDLETKDIEIKSNRNKVENLINSTQAYATLRSAGMCDVEALRITNLTSDPINTAKMNEEQRVKDADFEYKNEKRLAEISNTTNTVIDTSNELDVPASGANIEGQ